MQETCFQLHVIIYYTYMGVVRKNIHFTCAMYISSIYINFFTSRDKHDDVIKIIANYAS